MGESIKAEVTKKHGAVPMMAAPVPVPLNKRGIPRAPFVTFENTVLPSTRSQAHGNKLFLMTSTAVDVKKQEVFKPVIADIQHPVDESLQVYHGHAGVILGKHPPIPAAVTAGVQTAPDSKCVSEVGDLIKQLAKKLANELMSDPLGFYRNYSDAEALAMGGAVADKAGGIWDGIKSGASAVGGYASDLWNKPGETLSKTGDAIGGAAKSTWEWGKSTVNAAGELIGDAYDLGKAIANGEISFDDLVEELEAMLMEIFNDVACAMRDTLRDMLNSKEPIAKQLGTAVGAAKAGIAMEVLEGVLVSKGAGTVAKIAVKLAPLAKKLDRLNPKKLMDRLKARRNKPRSSKPTPSPTDKRPAPAKPDTKKQGDHENVDEGKNDSQKKPCPKKGRPVNPILGCKMLFGAEDFDWSLPSAMPLNWQRQYFSDAAHTGWFGQGWTLDFWRQLELNDRHHVMVDDQGRKVYFSRISAGNAEKRDYNIWDKVTHFYDDRDGYVVEDTGGTRYIFSSLNLIEETLKAKKSARTESH
jgi:hypothetical protein